MSDKMKLIEKGLPLRAGSPLREAEGGGQRREIVIISEGWGSSGYYSADVLKRDIPRIFPVGTHMYLNHPTEREDMERPERDVKDLIGKIVSTPRLAGIDIVAEALIYEHWVDVIAAMADDIGLSIRAYGVSEEGDAGGKHGPLIKALTEGLSVDYVTMAGRGGKIGTLIESAREHTPVEEKRNALNWLESRIHRDFTYYADNLFGEGYITREERKTLSAGIGKGLEAFASTVEEGAPALLNRDPYDDPEGNDVEVEEDNSGRNSANRLKKEKHQMEVDDKEFAELKESVKTLTANESSRQDEVKEAKEETKEAVERADRAEEANRLARANTVAREAIAEKFGKLPDKAQTRAVERSLNDDLPVDSDGKLDESKMKERANEAALNEAKYLAEAGVGTVEGFGSPDPTKQDDTVVEADAPSDASTKRLEEKFKRSGMSDSAAKAAAEGR